MASGSFSKKTKGYTIKTNWTSTINVAGNYSTVTCTHYLIADSGWGLSIGSRTNSCTVGSDTKSFSSSSISTSGGTTHTLGTTTHTVQHNSDGSKSVNASTSFKLAATISGSYIDSIVASKLIELDNIPRASSLTASNGTLNTAQTLTINRASDSFSHTIKYTCGSVKDQTIVTKTTGTSVSWTPPLELARQNTTGTSVSITLTTTTYNYNTGDTIGTSTKTITCAIPASVKPTCNVTVSDAMGYATTYGGYIQGISKFKVTVTGTTAYSSPIASYRTTANGSAYTASTFTTAVITSSGTATITGKVTDKRGRYGTKSVTATVLAYSKPKINSLSVNRCNADGTENMQGDYVKVTYSCNITSLSSKNTLTSIVKYKKTSDSKYTSKTDINASTTASYSNRSVIIAASSGSSYDIELSIADKFGTTIKNTSVSTAFTFQHFKGPFVDGEGLNQLMSFEPGETSYFSSIANNSNSATDYWKAVPLEDNWIHAECDLTGRTTTTESYLNFFILLDKLPNLKTSTSYTLVFEFRNVNITTMQSSLNLAQTHSGTGDDVFKGSFGASMAAISSGETMKRLTTTYDTFANNSLIALRNFHTVKPGDKFSYDIRISVLEGDYTNKEYVYEPYITECAASMGLGKIAELEGGLDVGFKARFNAGFEFPLLPAGTDLNNLTQPNIYRCGTRTAYSYVNYPVTGSVVGHLEVFTAGTDRIGQKYTVAHQTRSYTMYRYYESGAWGAWQSYLTGETVLYNNSEGSNGTISLSPSGTVGNSKYLEIYYNDNNNEGYNCTIVPIKSGAFASGASPIVVQLGLIEAADPAKTYFRRTKYTLTNSSLTPNVTNSGYALLSGTSASHSGGTNYIKIIKVVAKR